MRKLIFLGSPGVGKGTYAQFLKDALGIPHISTGDLLREEVKKKTALGLKVEKIVKSGGLVDDNLMIKLIEERISQDDCKNGFILDGFPRTINQAKLLSELTEISHVLNFKANDEIIIERLSGRVICKECQQVYNLKNFKPVQDGKCDKCTGEVYQREDDKPESIRTRLNVYKEKTAPLIDHYKGNNLLVEVVINKPFPQIKDVLLENVNLFLSGKIDKFPNLDLLNASNTNSTNNLIDPNNLGESIASLQKKIAEFNSVRGWQKDRTIMKDFLLNICEEAGEAWSVIKWVEGAKQEEMLAKHKAEYEDFVGDMLFLVLKIAWLMDIDSEKALKATLAEYEQRFPTDKIKKVGHANPLAGGIDNKTKSD